MQHETQPPFDEVLEALKHDDWKALHRYCAAEIVIGEYSRAYPNEAQFQRLFSSGLFPAGSVAEGFSHTHHVALTVIVAAPKQRDLVAFHAFCAIVKRSRPGIDSGLNLKDSEPGVLYGPAMEGDIASNVDWRVEFELIGKSYRVRKLLLLSH